MFVNQRGIVLLEALIAIVVLSIGILGTTSIFVNLQSHNITSSYLIRATVAIDDLRGKIRSTGLSSNSLYVGNYGQGSLGGTEPICADIFDCSVREMVDIFLWEFEQQIDGSFEGNKYAPADINACVSTLIEGGLLVEITWKNIAIVRSSTSSSSDACGKSIDEYTYWIKARI